MLLWGWPVWDGGSPGLWEPRAGGGVEGGGAWWEGRLPCAACVVHLGSALLAGLP